MFLSNTSGFVLCNVFDFLECGFVSLFGGFILSLLISGALLGYSTINIKRGSIEPIPLLVCITLFCLLFYHTTLMLGAIGSKNVVMDLIGAYHLQFGNEIDGSETKEYMVNLINENPLVSFFVDYADLEDVDWSHPIKSLQDVVGREFNSYIIHRIIWSLTFTAIAFVLVVFGSASNSRKSKRKRRRSHRDEDIFSLD